MRKRRAPNIESESIDAAASFSKKTQLGASGAVVGAIVAGPLGALVGGIVGTVFGAAAEATPEGASLSPKVIAPPPDKPAHVTSRRRKSSARAQAKGSKSISVGPHRRSRRAKHN